MIFFVSRRGGGGVVGVGGAQTENFVNWATLHTRGLKIKVFVPWGGSGLTSFLHTPVIAETSVPTVWIRGGGVGIRAESIFLLFIATLKRDALKTEKTGSWVRQ